MCAMFSLELKNIVNTHAMAQNVRKPWSFPKRHSPRLSPGTAYPENTCLGFFHNS